MLYSALDLTGSKKIDGYNTLFSGNGEMNCGHGLDIDREDWEQGYGLFRFELTPAGQLTIFMDNDNSNCYYYYYV